MIIVCHILIEKIVISLKLDKLMPLTNNVIIKLNEITTMIEDKSNLKEQEIEEIKSIFRDILKSGERYDVDDIESWFENEGKLVKQGIKNQSDKSLPLHPRQI